MRLVKSASQNIPSIVETLQRACQVVRQGLTVNSKETQGPPTHAYEAIRINDSSCILVSDVDGSL